MEQSSPRPVATHSTLSFRWAYKPARDDYGNPISGEFFVLRDRVIVGKVFRVGNGWQGKSFCKEGEFQVVPTFEACLVWVRATVQGRKIKL